MSELDAAGVTGAAGAAGVLEPLEAGAAVESLLDDAAESDDELADALTSALPSLFEAAGLALP